MTLLGYIFKLFSALYAAIGPDIKNQKAQALKESLSNVYSKWAPRLATDEEFLKNVVAALLVIFLFCLILVSAVLKSLASKGHVVSIAIASDSAFILYLLLFGRLTVSQLKDDLVRISKSYFKLSAIILLILNVILFGFICLYKHSTPSLSEMLRMNSEPLKIIVGVYVVLIIFRLLPFSAFHSSVTFIKYSVKQSLKQESNQLGHFLRYISLPALLGSLIHTVLLLFRS
ncbi:MAG: hypothetical protein JSS93_12890 [Bacteroidetes bacterium]|nr:hypothetical protein [Bacteroidota bacterium]